MEVTVGQFREFVNQSGYKYGVNWNDATAYANGQENDYRQKRSENMRHVGDWQASDTRGEMRLAMIMPTILVLVVGASGRILNRLCGLIRVVLSGARQR